MIKCAAIDPGASGAIAWIDHDGSMKCAKIPDTLQELRDMVYALSPGLVIVEDVGRHVQGNNAAASAKFAGTCGEIRGLLVGMLIPMHKITPQKWMRHFSRMPKDKNQRKTAIHAMVQERYPLMKIHKYQADAVALLTAYLEGAR